MSSMTLQVTTPSGTVRLAPDRVYVVGRSRNADVVVEDGRVSRRHVELTPGPDGWTARDVSTNGMWSAGTRRSTVEVSGETRLRLGAANGPEIVLLLPRPAPRQPAPPPEPDLSAAETVLAGQGRPGAAAPAPPPPARFPEPVGAGVPGPRPGPVPAAPAPAPPPAPAPAPAGISAWLRMLPTLIWLAAVGFSVGALLALS